LIHASHTPPCLEEISIEGLKVAADEVLGVGEYSLQELRRAVEIMDLDDNGTIG
jgi:hypothetical protein